MPPNSRAQPMQRLISGFLLALAWTLLLTGGRAAAQAPAPAALPPVGAPPVVAPPVAAPPAAPEDPLYQAHVLMPRDFSAEWTAADRQAAWDAGLPIPAVVTTTMNVFALAPPRPPALAARLQPAARGADGWQRVYGQSFDAGFPVAKYDGACQIVTLANHPRYRWGSSAQQSFAGSRAAASPLLGLTAAAGTYPENALLQFVCLFDDLGAAQNLMVQFALRLDRGNDGDTFFAGVSRDGQTFFGRRWRNTPPAVGGAAAWAAQRLFAPTASWPEASPGVESGRVAVLWEFRSDDQRTAAQGAWLDEVAVEQYTPPPALATCHTADPTLHVEGAPGGQPVSKGINLPPYPAHTPSGLAGHVSRLRASGVQWVRLEWQARLHMAGSVDDLHGPAALLNYVDLRHYDALLALLCAPPQPVGVLGLLDYWTLPDQSWKWAGRPNDAYRAALGEIAAFLAAYYGDRVGHWEIWNEPDYRATYLAADDYAALLTATSAAVKGAKGDAQVVFGGLGSADWVAANYFRQVVRLLPTDPIPYDVFAIHPYPSQEFRAGGRLIRDPSYLHYVAPTVLEPFLAILREAGHAPRPIWITEIGWNRAADSSNPETLACQAVYETMVTGAQQAAYLPQQFDILFKEVAWGPDEAAVAKIFWYQYMDVGLAVGDAACRGGRWTGGPVHVVDWWFGIYSGTDWSTGVLEPQPNAVECSFRAWPDPEALRQCQPPAEVATGGAGG